MSINDIPSLDGPSDQSVGYRNPPRHSRFQPGQTGNPLGRKRRTRPATVREELQKILLKDVSVLDGGKRRREPAIAVVMKKLLADGLKGDRKAALLVYRIAQELGVLSMKRPSAELDLSGLTREQRDKVFEAFLIMRNVPTK